MTKKRLFFRNHKKFWSRRLRNHQAFLCSFIWSCSQTNLSRSKDGNRSSYWWWFLLRYWFWKEIAITCKTLRCSRLPWKTNLTVEKFLLSNFSWSHIPRFGHIFLHTHYRMWPKSGVWDHNMLDSKNFSTVKN